MLQLRQTMGKFVGVQVVAVCVLAALLWAGSAVAGTMSHESQNAGDHGMMTHEGHGTGLPAGGLSEPEDTAYSLFMHRSSSIALIVIGVLVLIDRLTERQYSAVRIGIGTTWLVLGAHVFIKADLEGWPIGPAGFLESFSMPTAGEWIQHKLLSLIPLALGIWTLLSRRVPANAYWSYALGGVLALGGAGLLVHQHLDHQTMDLVNLQHRFMALTVLLIASFLLADGLNRLTWTAKPFLLPWGLIVLGLQLALYVE